MRYIRNRNGFLLLSIWAALTLNFFIPGMMPGNLAMALLAHFVANGAPLLVRPWKRNGEYLMRHYGVSMVAI